MAESAAGGNGGVSHRREKSEIYKTLSGKVIVENELLNFLTVKMRTFDAG